MIRLLGVVLLDHPPDCLGLDIRLNPSIRLEQHLCGKAAKFLSEPLRKRDAKAHLRAVQDLIGYDPAERMLEQHLSADPAQLEAGWNLSGKLHEVVVQERRA